jgi:hypothetical protein
MSRFFAIFVILLTSSSSLLQVIADHGHVDHVLEVQNVQSQLVFSSTPTLVELPSDNLASHRFSTWLKAFNTKDRETILTYHAQHFPFDIVPHNIDDEVRFSENTGGFDIADVVDSNSGKDTPQHALTVILHSITKRDPQYAKAEMTVDPKHDGHPVTVFELRRIPTPVRFVPDARKEEYERALAPLTPKRRRVVVEGIVDVFREQYINPVVGEKFISFIESKLEKGEYDTFTDSQKFAKQLSLDAFVFDKHARVLFHEPHPPEEPSKAQIHAEETNDRADEKKRCAEMYHRFKKDNFAFDEPLIE